MAEKKLSPLQLRRIEEIQEFLRVVDHLKRLVAELEGNRAAKSTVISGICSSIARELTQMRQRALTANIGTLADVAGALSVLAGRMAGINLKIRGLNDGVHSLTLQLDQALKAAMTPEPKDKTPKKPS